MFVDTSVYIHAMAIYENESGRVVELPISNSQGTYKVESSAPGIISVERTGEVKALSVGTGREEIYYHPEAVLGVELIQGSATFLKIQNRPYSDAQLQHIQDTLDDLHTRYYSDVTDCSGRSIMDCSGIIYKVSDPEYTFDSDTIEQYFKTRTICMS